MPVRSEDIAEPTFVFAKYRPSTFRDCIEQASGVLEAISDATTDASEEQIVLIAVVGNHEQAEVVELMVKSARQALDAKRDIEAAVSKIVTPPQMSAEELEQQRISFAYGNVHLDQPDVTKQDVIDAAERLREVAGEG